jgi:hypothetical protein
MEDRKALIRERYEPFSDQQLELVIRRNTMSATQQPAAVRQEFGTDLVVEVAKEILADRRSADA